MHSGKKRMDNAWISRGKETASFPPLTHPLPTRFSCLRNPHKYPHTHRLRLTYKLYGLIAGNKQHILFFQNPDFKSSTFSIMSNFWEKASNPHVFCLCDTSGMKSVPPCYMPGVTRETAAPSPAFSLLSAPQLTLRPALAALCLRPRAGQGLRRSPRSPGKACRTFRPRAPRRKQLLYFP